MHNKHKHFLPLVLDGVTKLFNGADLALCYFSLLLRTKLLTVILCKASVYIDVKIIPVIVIDVQVK